MMRLYKKVRRSRSSAIEGINFGSPAEVPELQEDEENTNFNNSNSKLEIYNKKIYLNHIN